MAKNTSSSKLDLSWLLTNLGGLVAVTCWGLSFVATKILMEGGITESPSNIPLSPTEAYLYRFILAYFIIMLFCHRRWFCDNWRDEMLALLCGLTSGSIYFIAENTALEYTYTSNVSLLSATAPLVCIMIVGVLYKSERPGRGIIIGSVIAFLGVACVVLNSVNAADLHVNPIGDMLALATAFLWAFYSLIVKKLNVVYDALFITRKTFFYGVLTAFPFLLFEPTVQNPVEVLTHGWPWVDGSLIFLVLGPSVIAFYLWSVTIRKVGAVICNNYLYIQPVVTVIASALILGEQIAMLGYVGFALILFGLWFGYYLEERIGIRMK